MHAALLAKIVSIVAADGVDGLKNWIKAGRDGKEAALSVETLASVRLDKSKHFLWWSLPDSKYYSFFCKCLQARNPYALWAESNKGVAYDILVSRCFLRGHWDPSYMLPDGAWRLRKLWRMGRPRCGRCRRLGHTALECDYQYY